jgi:GMP synthase (glutamine-hydrolysing)
VIYLVDNTIDGHGVSPGEIRTALKTISPNDEIVTDYFSNVSLERVKSLSPTHIVLSGQSHPWTSYTPESLAGVFDVIRQATQPILGICGGHQQIALAYGARVDLMQRISPGEGYEGALRIRGYYDVETESAGIFNGLRGRVTVWNSHCDEVKDLPKELKRTATSLTCAIQAMQHESRPLFGVQFHPDLFDDDHPHGRRIIENFLSL